MNEHKVEGLLLWGQRSTHRGRPRDWLCEHAPWRPVSPGGVTMWGSQGVMIGLESRWKQ